MSASKGSSSFSIIALIGVAIAIAAYFYSNTQVGDEITSSKTSSSSVSRVDQATGISFASTQKFHSTGKTPLSLLGVGTRKKAGIINVYSLGLFASSPLVKAVEKSNDSTNKCDTILESKHPKSIQIVFNMKINPENVAEALSQLDPSVVDSNITDQFSAMVLSGMPSGKLQKNDEMTLEWKGLDRISVTIRGKFVGEMKDKNLAQSVLKLYLGEEGVSVSPSLKKDIGCSI